MVFVTRDITQLVMYLPYKNEVFSHCGDHTCKPWGGRMGRRTNL